MEHLCYWVKGHGSVWRVPEDLSWIRTVQRAPHIHFEPPSIKTTRGLDPVSSVHVSSCQAGRHVITASRTHSIHQSGCSDWTTESFLVCECRSLYMMNVSWTEQHVRQFQLFYGKRASGARPISRQDSDTVSVILSNKQTRGYQCNLFSFQYWSSERFSLPGSRARSPGSRARSPGARALLIHERHSCSERFGLIKM